MQEQKPYFAKWLPVEGGIQKGDYVAFEGNIKDILQYPGQLTSLKYSDKKVKLFMCTKEITWDDLQNDKEIRKIHVYFDNSEPPFKNLGLIINQENIKEGDEFDRNDFECIWQNEKGEQSSCMHDLEGKRELVVKILKNESKD